MVDTDVLIDHLRGHRALDLAAGFLAYSTVTRCELLAGSPANQRERDLLDGLIEVPVDRAVAESAAAVRRNHGTRIADALIAGTALHLQVPLLTRNIRDFEGIKGLKIRTPA